MDSKDRSAAAVRMAAASLDLKIGSCSVCELLSTIFGVCHSAEVGSAALAAESPEEAEVVAKCPTANFCMALLNRPTGRYQWPLRSFFIWR